MHVRVCVCVCVCGCVSSSRWFCYFKRTIGSIWKGEGLLQDKGSRFIQLQDKTEVFSIAEFFTASTSLLLLRGHSRYCCLLTWQQRCTLDKLILLIFRACSFTSDIGIYNPLGTGSLCALSLLLWHLWKVCNICFIISGSVFIVDSLSFNSRPRRGVRL